MKLIMLPYAGSIFNAYREWRLIEDTDIDIISIDYNGRGRRSNFDSPANWSELISGTFEQVKNIIDSGEEYVLLGHSMGAKVALDVYGLISRKKLALPKYIVFSGAKAFGKTNVDFAKMNEEEFKNYFIDLGGINAEILKEQELMDLLYDYLREDVALLEGFRYNENEINIKCPVIVMNGKDDLCSSSTEWADTLKTPCIYLTFSGGHFFITEEKYDVYSELKETIFASRGVKVS